MTPLEKLQNSLDSVNSQIEALKEDLFFSPLSKEVAEEKQVRITVLQCQREVLEQEFDELGQFVAKMSQIKNGKIKKEQRDLPAYNLFYTTLDPWKWDFSPEQATCGICGKAGTRKSALVRLIEPISAKLMDICPTCYQDRAAQKTIAHDQQPNSGNQS